MDILISLITNLKKNAKNRSINTETYQGDLYAYPHSNCSIAPNATTKILHVKLLFIVLDFYVIHF